MASKKDEEEVAGAEGEQDAAEPAEKAKAPKAKPKLAHLLGTDGSHINTYSSADHEDYKERAEKVAAKHKGSVTHE